MCFYHLLSLSPFEKKYKITTKLYQNISSSYKMTTIYFSLELFIQVEEEKDTIKNKNRNKNLKFQLNQTN